MDEIICLSSEEEGEIAPNPKVTRSTASSQCSLTKIVPKTETPKGNGEIKTKLSQLVEDNDDSNASISSKQQTQPRKDENGKRMPKASTVTNTKKRKKGKYKSIYGDGEGVKNGILDFFRDCIEFVKERDKKLVKTKVPVIKILLAKLGNEIIKDEMEEPLIKYRKLLEENPKSVLLWFTEMYEVLKHRYQEKSMEPGEGGNFSQKEKESIIKLRKTLYKLQRRIKKLDEREVNFDEEENSSYMMSCRYKERADKVYKALCEILKKDPNCSRIVFKRLDFAGSNYQEINVAINKFYRNYTAFPTYFDFDRIIRKCVEEKALKIPPAELLLEIRECFNKLGNLLQHRRRLDLLDCHSMYLDKIQDLGNTDPELQEKLDVSRKQGQSKLDEIFQKYTRMQELGQTTELSPDSDDSNRPDSDSDVEMIMK